MNILRKQYNTIQYNTENFYYAKILKNPSENKNHCAMANPFRIPSRHRVDKYTEALWIGSAPMEDTPGYKIGIEVKTKRYTVPWIQKNNRKYPYD